MGGLDGEPGARSHSPGVNRGLHSEQQDLTSMPIDGEDHVAHDIAVLKEEIGQRSQRFQGLLNVGQRQDRLRGCVARAGTSRRLLARGKTLPHEGTLRVALEVLEGILKVRDQRRTIGISQGNKRDRPGCIISANGYTSNNRGHLLPYPGGLNDVCLAIHDDVPFAAREGLRRTGILGS